MTTKFNSASVRNEVATMQANEGNTSSNVRKVNKGVLMFIAYVTAALGVIMTLSSLGLIPKD
jgi:hypothetical protein